MLAVFDNLQRSLLESICNINLSDSAWTQASLPTNSGGLGIRSLAKLAPSAFLASAAGCSLISNMIFPHNPPLLKVSTFHKAVQLWNANHPHPETPPSGPTAYCQKAWDSTVVTSLFKSLSDGSDPKSKAQLLAAQKKESGAWLTAPPISSLGLRMEDCVIRIAVGLRFGIPFCTPHSCCCCGELVDESGTHGLCCRKSQGRLPRHSMNDIVKRALMAIEIPSILEPQGLCRSDGKHPDGVTIIPWDRGRALVWDATCHDTFAPTNIAGMTCEISAVNKMAAGKLPLLFLPFSSSTTGPMQE